MKASVLKYSISTGLMASVCVAFAAVAPSNPVSAQSQTVTFMSGGAGGDWYRYLTAKSECLRQFSDEFDADVVPTAGGMEAFQRIRAGEAEFGYTFQNVMHNSWHGLGDYEDDPVREIMAVASAIEPSRAHIVVRRDSGIETLDDLRGKDVSPGPVGTVSYGIIQDMLEAAGVFDDLRISNISHNEQVTYLGDERIDAFGIVHALPSPLVTEVAVTTSIDLLSIQEELEEVGFFEEFPHYLPDTIPAGTYDGVDYDVETANVGGPFIVNADVPEDVVEGVMEVLWSDDCLNYLTENHPALGQMAVDNPTVGLTTPLHPGAVRFWEGRGVEITAPQQ